MENRVLSELPKLAKPGSAAEAKALFSLFIVVL